MFVIPSQLALVSADTANESSAQVFCDVELIRTRTCYWEFDLSALKRHRQEGVNREIQQRNVAD